MAPGEEKKMTFGFKKTVEKRDFRASADTSFANEVQQSQQDDEEVVIVPPRKKLVIPVPEGGDWSDMIKKLEEEKKTKGSGVPVVSTEGLDAESAAAIEELLEDAVTDTDVGRPGTSRVENLPRLNPGEEGAARFGVEATLNDYKEIPVEDFGIAMLRGMGMTDEEWIAMKKQQPEEIKLRPVGLGLGANEKLARKNRAKQGEDEDVIKPGHHVKIEIGSHSGQFGKVEGIDADSRIVIRLALSNEVVSKSDGTVTRVSEEEYKKDSKLINRDTYEEYQKRQRWLVLMGKDSMNGTNGSSNSGPDMNGKKEERVRVKEERTGEGKRESRDVKPDRSRERKARSPSPPPRERPRPWVRENLRVRMISKTYKEGKYYNAKLVVIDVPTVDRCTCITDDKRVLDDIIPKDLETVVPRDSGSRVMIVRGEFAGKKGRIIERDRGEYRATVELERGKTVSVDFDSICEYIRQ